MLIKILRALLLIFLVTGLSYSQVLATTPDDYCKTHNDSMVGGTCDICGDECVTITGNLGDKIYKKCGEVQCTQTNDCKTDCPKCACD